MRQVQADSRARILVVEDDPVARRFLGDNLLADGFEVTAAGTVAGARARLTADEVDLAVIDLGLPDEDGLRLLSLVREGEAATGAGGHVLDPDLPVIVLSGRGGEGDRLRGFRFGADDYVVKPYAYPELHARIEAVLRRRRRRRTGSRLRVGPLKIDTVCRTVVLDGERIQLSVREFALLTTLASDPTRVFTRDELLCEVWGFREPVRTRTLDSHVNRLRGKLGRNGRRFIVNVWGVGYRLLDGPQDP